MPDRDKRIEMTAITPRGRTVIHRDTGTQARAERLAPEWFDSHPQTTMIEIRGVQSGVILRRIARADAEKYRVGEY